MMSTTQSLENIGLNETIPKHMDTEVALVSDVEFGTKDTF
jgi:hypothetical protein